MATAQLAAYISEEEYLYGEMDLAFNNDIWSIDNSILQFQNTTQKPEH